MSVADNVAQVRKRLAVACARAGRPPEAVRLMAATKTVPHESVREAALAGVALCGENRVQAMAGRRVALADLALEWHLIGPLQSNKAKPAVELFDGVDTVDRRDLAERLDRLWREQTLAGPMSGPGSATRSGNVPLAVMIEVNIGGEAQKAGVAPEACEALAEVIGALPGLRLAGLMAIPPATTEPEASRPYFAAMRRLWERLRGYAAGGTTDGIWELSMGMSHDFEVAAEEGATIVRLGTALFGERSPRFPKE